MRSIFLTTLALTHAAMASASELAPSADGEPAPAVAAPAELDWWTESFSEALASARAEQREVCVYFWLDGSQRCAELYEQTLQDPDVVAALSSCLSVDVEVGSPGAAELVAHYGIQTVPTTLFLNSAGELEDGVIGFATPGSFLHEVARIQSRTNTLSGLRTAVELAPEDLDAWLALGLKLRDVGQGAASKEAFARIRKQDPTAQTTPGARVALWELLEGLTQSGVPLAELDLRPLHEHLARVRNSEVRFEGWNWIIDTETRRGRRGAVREVVARAFPDLPVAKQVEWASTQAQALWDAREELDAGERRLALALARASAERAFVERDAPPPAPPGLEDWELAAQAAEYESGMTMRLVDALLVLARCQVLNGEKAAAAETLERCREISPGNAEVARLSELVARS